MYGYVCHGSHGVSLAGGIEVLHLGGLRKVMWTNERVWGRVGADLLRRPRGFSIRVRKIDIQWKPPICIRSICMNRLLACDFRAPAKSLCFTCIPNRQNACTLYAFIGFLHAIFAARTGEMQGYMHVGRWGWPNGHTTHRFQKLTSQIWDLQAKQFWPEGKQIDPTSPRQQMSTHTLCHTMMMMIPTPNYRERGLFVEHRELITLRTRLLSCLPEYETWAENKWWWWTRAAASCDPSLSPPPPTSLCCIFNTRSFFTSVIMTAFLTRRSITWARGIQFEFCKLQSYFSLSHLHV